MEKNNHLIVKKYLEEHSLVESNIISFNEFIDHRIQEIVDEISETMNNEEFEITLGKIKVERTEKGYKLNSVINRGAHNDFIKGFMKRQ